MSDKKRNILFIPSWYPNRNNPTFGIFIKRHAEAVALYNNVAVLHVSSEINISKNYDMISSQNESVHTVIVYYKKVSLKIPGISHFIKFFRYIRAFNKGWKQINESFGKP